MSAARFQVPDGMTARQFIGVVPIGTVVSIPYGRAERVPLRWFWECECGAQGEAHTLRHCKGDLAFHRQTEAHRRTVQ